MFWIRRNKLKTPKRFYICILRARTPRVEPLGGSKPYRPLNPNEEVDFDEPLGVFGPFYDEDDYLLDDLEENMIYFKVDHIREKSRFMSPKLSRKYF